MINTERFTYRINLAIYADNKEEADQMVSEWLAAAPFPLTSFPSTMPVGGAL